MAEFRIQLQAFRTRTPSRRPDSCSPCCAKLLAVHEGEASSSSSSRLSHSINLLGSIGRHEQSFFMKVITRYDLCELSFKVGPLLAFFAWAFPYLSQISVLCILPVVLHLPDLLVPSCEALIFLL
ncbi:hypothetical protein GOP47_0023978 [Adiantum capillus-veneris]|uniref:Uncharacterized protein n=1 Tax=Adiantum capillus-veneris TaxID=13818 RepID=A0A9D4U5Q8_ADICA|nr:hypothetical protein GOP47_0023978 [Adiantum capillus-veneris]